MRASHSRKFIFLSNPRTASRAVRALLDPYSDEISVPYEAVSDFNPFYNHITAREVRDIFRDRGLIFSDYFSFCFVRNPLDRLLSLHSLSIEERQRKKLPSLSFDEFVKKNVTDVFWERDFRPKNKFFMTSPLQYFVCDEIGEIIVDKIYMQENIVSAVMDLAERLGVPAPNDIPVVGKSNRGRFRNDVSKTSLDVIRSVYHWEIEMFGYEV